jgi:RNA polymerase sigma-70 factor (TIGR02960 family)
MAAAELIDRARAGDALAFASLVDPYRRELHVHCYRILGSVQDAEDALQETLLAAWRDLDGFEGRSSFRTWLYRLATNRCLNALRSARRRPQTDWPPPGIHPPAATRLGEVTWLEPYPDVLLEELSDRAPGPEARYEAREAISLAFVTAVQLLPARQRAALILRDVLGFPAREVAGMLDASEESVTSALKRARAALARGLPSPPGRQQPSPGSPAEQELITRLTDAYEGGDIGGLVAMLADDVLMTMPPIPLEYQGRALVTQFLAAVVFRPDVTLRLIATRANGQPAAGVYHPDPQAGIARPAGLLVFTFAGDRISAITRFDASVLPPFELPAAVPARRA